MRTAVSGWWTFVPAEIAHSAVNGWMVHFEFRTWENFIHSSVTPGSRHMAPRLIREPCAKKLQSVLAPGMCYLMFCHYANVKPQKFWQRLQSSKTLRAPPCLFICNIKMNTGAFPLSCRPHLYPSNVPFLPTPLHPIHLRSSPSSLIPYSGLCAVSGSGCCWLSGRKKMSGGRGGGGAIGGGVGESLQTLGASPSPCQTRVTAGFC